jgi:hypothetical protein
MIGARRSERPEPGRILSRLGSRRLVRGGALRANPYDVNAADLGLAGQERRRITQRRSGGREIIFPFSHHHGARMR